MKELIGIRERNTRDTCERAKTTAFWFTGLTVKRDTGWHGMCLRGYDDTEGSCIMHQPDTPKADNLTNRFEDVDELILCNRGEKGRVFVGRDL